MTNKYRRTIYGVDKEGNAGSLQVDVYDTLVAYPTKNPALDHLIKKALCPGQRGHKDLLTDLDDIIKSAQRAKAMIVNKMACCPDVTLPTEGDVHPLCEARVGSVVKPTTTPLAFPDIKGRGTLVETDEKDPRPSSFTGNTLCYYPDKLHAEGILRTFQELAQTAGVATRAVERADHVAPNGVLIDGPNPTYKVIRRMAEKGIAIYGVREANVILRGHISDKQSTAKMAEAMDAPQEAEPARGYAYSFSHRPSSFDGRVVHIVEGITEKTLATLEHKIAQVDTIPDYVRGTNDCPERSIVIRDNNAPHPADDGRWHFTVAQAIAVLVKDHAKETTNA